MLSGDVGKEKAVALAAVFSFFEFPNGERKGSAEGTAAPRRAHYFTGTSPLGRVGKV